LIGLSIFASGCLHPKIGPRSLPYDRAMYAESLADSWKQQTLLNIVKIRYVDPPVFVDIGSIVASYSLEQNASLGGSITPGSNTGNIAIGGSGKFSNTPTITYTPLTGSAFIRGLATPLKPELVFAAIQNGLPADTILFSTIFSINGLRNQSASLAGITPADLGFHRVRTLMRSIQLSGEVRIYVREDVAQKQSYILALPTRNLSPQIHSDLTELRRLLKLNPEATEFSLVYGPVASNDREIAVLTRSINSLMQNMAAQVEVPEEDERLQYAFPGFDQTHSVPGVVRLIRVRSGKQKPSDPFVTAFYKGNWYWIERGDLESKHVFGQLMTLFTMVDSGPRENAPILTIPSR